MLITVKKSKLVLGRTVYLRGDVFECRDAEAKLLIAGGMVTASPDAKVSKASPTTPTTGMSVKPGTPAASQEVPAPRVDRQRLAPIQASPTLSASVNPTPSAATRSTTRPSFRPIQLTESGPTGATTDDDASPKA